MNPNELGAVGTVENFRRVREQAIVAGADGCGGLVKAGAIAGGVHTQERDGDEALRERSPKPSRRGAPGTERTAVAARARILVIGRNQSGDAEAERKFRGLCVRLITRVRVGYVVCAEVLGSGPEEC